MTGSATARKPRVSALAPAWPADKVQRRPVNDLVFYARNARTHSDEQIAQIAGSIREFGFAMPILVDETGVIIAGHGRVLAAQRLGLPEVPVMTARGWSDRQIRAYRLADNKLALNAGWDDELLGLELADLRELGMSLDVIGFSQDEIDKLITEPQAPGEFGAYDESIETEHQCPRCGYRWSGKAATSNGGNADEQPEDC